MNAGMEDLLKIDDDTKEQLISFFHGGLDANENQQKLAELQFEAWMRLLDSRVKLMTNLSSDYKIMMYIFLQS